jgi:hypothetical protein
LEPDKVGLSLLQFNLVALNQCFSEKVCFQQLGLKEVEEEEVAVVVVVVAIVAVIEEYYNATKHTLFIFFTTFHSFCRSVFTAQNLMTLYGCFFSSFFLVIN